MTKQPGRGESRDADQTDIVFSPAGPPGPGAAEPAGIAETAADTGRTLGEPAEAVEPSLSPADQSTVEALRAGTALLIVQHGPNAGARFLLDGDVTSVGRHPGNDIFLDDVTVSRKHAQFRRTETGFSVVDLGSLNGTYVRRERIEGETPLQTGDEVQVGKYRLAFHQSGNPAGPAAAGDTA